MSSISTCGDKYSPVTPLEWQNPIFEPTCSVEALAQTPRETEASIRAKDFKALDSVTDRRQQASLITKLCQKNLANTNLQKLQVS